jgi:hypothetical protein
MFGYLITIIAHSQTVSALPLSKAILHGSAGQDRSPESAVNPPPIWD